MIDKKMSLPYGWKVTTLGDVAKYLNGRAFKPIEWESDGLPIIRIQNLNNSDAPYNYSTKNYEDRFKVRKGDLLFAWSASLGAYIWKSNDAWLNQHIFKVIPSENCDKSYLYYYLEKIVSELYSKAHGSGMVHVTKGKFEQTAILLPPIEEQNLIVEKIEELFSELDKGIENLKTAQQQLKVYRQAVLKWAFEGKLTNHNVKDGELPEGWTIVKTGDHVDYVVPNRDKPKTFTGNIPWLTTPSLDNRSIKVDLSKIKIGLSKAEVNLYKAKIIPKNSVVMTCVGTFGLAVVLSKEAIINQQLHAFLPSDTFLPQYLAYNIKNQQGYCEKNATTTTIAYLNKTNCNSIPIPLCSIDEQKKVVQEIESRLSVCDKMEETINTSLQQAEALRQSILKRAFEGKLVTVDELIESP